jgi:hypothetical protein
LWATNKRTITPEPADKVPRGSKPDDFDLDELDQLDARFAVSPLRVSNPRWNLDTFGPDTDIGQERIADFLQTHQRAGSSLQEVQRSARQYFPQLDPATLAEPYRRAGHAVRLQTERPRVARQYNPDFEARHTVRRGTPFLETATNVVGGIEYGPALRRFNGGHPEPGDYRTIALYEHYQRHAREYEPSLGAVGTILLIPALFLWVCWGWVSDKHQTQQETAKRIASEGRPGRPPQGAVCDAPRPFGQEQGRGPVWTEYWPYIKALMGIVMSLVCYAALKLFVPPSSLAALAVRTLAIVVAGVGCLRLAKLGTPASRYWQAEIIWAVLFSAEGILAMWTATLWQH